MPIKNHTCVSIACDVCGYVYDEDEYTTHFADLDEARRVTRSQGWLITSDGIILCAAGDAEHSARLLDLSPPEPVFVPDGQTEIDMEAS